MEETVIGKSVNGMTMIRKKQGSKVTDGCKYGATGNCDNCETRFTAAVFHALSRGGHSGKDCVQRVYVTNDQNQGPHDK